MSDTDPRLVTRLLAVLEDDVLPMMRRNVQTGSKAFGAAILRRHDLSLVIAGANNERENPLWHGEVHTLKLFYELPAAARPATRDCLFLTTHEPCSLCLSAITWAGFDNFYYFFNYQDTKDAFAIPHDLNILAEVFKVPDGQYAHANGYWRAHDLKAMAAAADVDRLQNKFAELSEIYQQNKGQADIPLA